MNNKWRPAIATAMVVLVAACTDDDADDTAPTTAPDDGSETSVSLETIPARTGEVTLTLDGATYQATIPHCVLEPGENPDDDQVELLATGTHDDNQIRIEHGPNTGHQLALFIGVEGPIDPGTTTWLGRPDLDVDDTTATDHRFEMSDPATGDTADAAVTIDCPDT